MSEVLTYEEARKIYQMIDESLDRQDEDIVFLYHDMIRRAIHYAQIRSEWNQITREERIKKDSARSAVHDGFIASVNIIARAEGTAGEQWKAILSDDRKRIGDLACYIALFKGLKAR